eukprot:s796_g12.t1
MRGWLLLRSTLGREPCLGHKQILRSFAGSTPERPRRNRRRANRGADVWGEEDDDKQSKNFRQLRAFAQADFAKDAQDAREALRWHRKEVHHAQEVKDALVEVSTSREEDSGARWWDSWDAEWDEGWDWEEKWRTAAGRSELVNKDDPRRPRGPLWSCEDGYQPVATLNHEELVAAIVSARNGQADELQWQALCRRAELVAMSMTPAELLATARCVGERQSGQLRLLWKIAMLSVEHLGSFTVQDLACLANVYSSIDSVHHGMLNVVALVVASSDDERCLDHVLAVDVLASFARAQYPLPLLMGEARKVLLRDSAELAPALALSALRSFSSLEALDGELLAALLDRALPSTSLEQTCATAAWAWQVLALLEKVEVPASLENAEHLIVRERPSISGRDAVERITATLSESLRSFDLPRLRFIQTGDASFMCLAVSQKGQPSQLPSPQILASALLLTHKRTEADSCLAAELVAASSGSMQPVWSAEQQVQWLRVAVEAAEAAPVSNAELVQPLLKALPGHAPHLLIPEAASLASLFPRILMQYPTSEAAVAETAVALAQAVRPDLFRLRVHEARQVLQGYCSLMPVLTSQVNAEKILPEASRLFKSMLDGFPAKLKSESVFHRGGQAQPSAPELAAWCVLLSNADLIQPLGIEVPESIWEVLATECQEALTAAGLGQESDVEESGAAIAEQMLLAFLRKRGDHDWSILNPETPLGAMARAVQALWRRAVARDGELEDSMHEPPAIPGEDALRLRELMAQNGLELPEEVVI